jgi:RNA recognition motif-containing protein
LDEPPSRGTKRPQQASESTEDRRLFAENLALGLNWRQLKDFFTGYGVNYADVIEIENEAFGIVEFESRALASEACMQFNGVILEGKAARLRQDRGEFEAMRARKRPRTGHEADTHQRPPSRSMQEPPHQAYDDRSRRRGDDGGGPRPGIRPAGGPQVFVGNLDFRTSWQDLKDHMRQAGNVKFCDVLKDGEGRPKGSGLVEYFSEDECKHAIKTLNDTSLGQRQIYVKMARETDDRRPQRS